jgi:hypothetical protein
MVLSHPGTEARAMKERSANRCDRVGKRHAVSFREN